MKRSTRGSRVQPALARRVVDAPDSPFRSRASSWRWTLSLDVAGTQRSHERRASRSCGGSSPVARYGAGGAGGLTIGRAGPRLDAIDPAREFRVGPTFPFLAGRHPVALAHGPSLKTLVPELLAHRDRLYVIGAAAHGTASGGRRSVARRGLLADAAPSAADQSVQAWTAAPARIRARLEQQTALVTQPLAPVAIIVASGARVSSTMDWAGCRRTPRCRSGARPCCRRFVCR